MSIGAYIDNAIDDEDSFYLPIATEIFFNKYWFPVAEKLKLPMIWTISTGIDINTENWNTLKKELGLLIQFYSNQNIKDEFYSELCGRINLLIQTLDNIFEKRSDTIVFVG